MVELTKDNKSNTWLITTTDAEGFHKQINLTDDDMQEVIATWMIVHDI